MKNVSFTEFRKNASGFISEVEHGETIIVLRRGKPVAEVLPISKETVRTPSWKKPGIRLKLEGRDLTTAILEERENGS